MAMAAVAGVCDNKLSIRDVSLMHNTADAQIPEKYKVTEVHRPCLSLAPSLDLPVIDLAPLFSSTGEDGRAGVVSEMLSAAKEWGFFQLVNHGVPTALLERMVLLGHEFFCLPTEQKERGAADSGGIDGYAGRGRMVRDVGCLWIEGVTLFSILAEPRVERFADSVWPGGNPVFCETMCEVGRQLEALQTSLLELLAEGLELPKNFFNQPFEELKAAGQANRGAHFRFNYYPACAQPSLALGTMAHTDPTLMTLLYQDSGYGLQILSKDRSSWHLVDYKPGGIIIFINDVLQGWSNGVLQAAIHRAVLNAEKSRLSFFLSTSPPADLVLQPACSPMAREPRYKPFTFKEYSSALGEYGYLPPDEVRKGIDIFAGIPSHE